MQDNIVWYFKKQEMKDNAPPDSVFIARDWKAMNGKMVKQFTYMSSYTTILQYILQLYKKSEVVCLYEVVRFNVPCKLYLDVEWEDDLTDKRDDSQKIIQRIVEISKNILQNLVHNRANADDSRFDCHVLQSSRRMQKSIKNSFHIIYPQIIMKNNTDEMIDIVQKIHDKCSNLLPKNPIDLSVYTKDRLFRMPLCCKAQDSTHTPLTLINGNNNASTILSCFITNVCKTDIDKWVVSLSKKLHLKEKTIPRKIAPKKHTNVHHQTPNTETKINFTKLEAKIQNIIFHLGSPAKVIFHSCINDGLIMFRLQHKQPGQKEICLAHGIKTKITHCNDNQLIAVDLHGIVRVICPHKGKCQGAKATICRISPEYFIPSRI